MARTKKGKARSEWKQIIREYDARTGNVPKPALPEGKAKSSTAHSNAAKADIFARHKRLDGSAWAGRRQK
jgi:hypothetical protein